MKPKFTGKMRAPEQGLEQEKVEGGSSDFAPAWKVHSCEYEGPLSHARNVANKYTASFEVERRRELT
jgi:hypothetical protein